MSTPDKAAAPATQGLAPAQQPATSESPEFRKLLEKDHIPTQGVFQDPVRFAHAQRVATMLCESNLAPAHFQGRENLGSAVIAVDMAFRLNMNPLMVMQQLYVVHGKPGWSAQFVIAVINASGEFSPIRFRFSGDGDVRQCVAYAKDLKSGEVLEGTPVSIALAKKEGWYGKTGSKWQSMAEQMLAYRAASFWGRIYAPEMFMGLPTVEEINDMDLPAPTEPAALPKTKPNLTDQPKTETPKPAAPKETTQPKRETKPKEPETKAAVVETAPTKPEPSDNDGDLGQQQGNTAAADPVAAALGPEPDYIKQAKEEKAKEQQAGESPLPGPHPKVAPVSSPLKYNISQHLIDKLKEAGVGLSDFEKWVDGRGLGAAFTENPSKASQDLLSSPAIFRKLVILYGTAA